MVPSQVEQQYDAIPHPSHGFHRAQLVRRQVVVHQRNELAIRRSPEAGLCESGGVDDRGAASFIQPGQVAGADRLEFLVGDAGAERPALVHRRAAGAGVDVGDRDHNALAK